MPKKRDMNAPYWQQLREAERHIIEYALEHGGSLRGTAALLGISSNYLSERTRELGIPTPEVRPGPKPGGKRPQLHVVGDDEALDASEDTTSTAPKPPKPPKRSTAQSEEPEDAEDDRDREDEEDWYEDAEEDGDEDDDADFDDDGDGDEDEVRDDEDDQDREDGDVEDANQSGN